jgi:hypothetical protein
MTPTIGERLVTHRAAKRPRIGRRDRPVASRSQIADGFSFCYRVPVGGQRRAKDGANELRELELVELGPTLKGMNPATELHAVKSALASSNPARLSLAALRKQSSDLALEVLTDGINFPSDSRRRVPPRPNCASEPSLSAFRSRARIANRYATRPGCSSCTSWAPPHEPPRQHAAHEGRGKVAPGIAPAPLDRLAALCRWGARGNDPSGGI